jgi:hypothetical protein
LTVVCSPTIRPAPAPAPAPARTIDSPAGRRRRGAPPASGVRRVPDPSFTAAAGNTGNKTTTTPAAATVSPCIAGVRPANTRARTYQTGPPPDTTHMQYRRRNDTSVHTVRLLRVHHHRHLDWTRRGRSGQRCESTAPPAGHNNPTYSTLPRDKIAQANHGGLGFPPSRRCVSRSHHVPTGQPAASHGTKGLA